ncbi:MAG: alpha/beta fold hydrolase [Planctomycetota bacterium]
MTLPAPLALLAASLTLCASLFAGEPTADNPKEDPRSAKPGKVYQWTSGEDELPFEFYVPKSYDPEKGANLTVVLHGNGLDHRWTFLNHPIDEFRPDDIIVSPDGTTPKGKTNTGAAEFLGGSSDVERLHEFLGELKEIWNVRRTYLYGHSQGSFFVFYYAGEHPEDIDGVCGHASGTWANTQMTKKAHHVAIGFLHGTDDHVPYGQSHYSAGAYREKKFPLVHMRTLFDWPHRPHWMQAASVLAWCEGMTSDDPDGVAACVETLAQPKLPMGANWSALWAVADRLSGLEGASAKQKKLGRSAADAVDKLAADHAKAISKGLGKGKLGELSKGTWAGELIRFVEDFHGVPAQAEFLKKQKKAIAALEKTAQDALEDYWKNRKKKPDKAFDAGVELLSGGFLSYRCVEVLDQLKKWSDGGTVKLSKKDKAAFEELVELYEEARKEGFADFVKRCEKAKL